MEDLIRRIDAIEAIRRERNIKALLDIPTVEPKQGEWIRHEISRYSYDREQGDINAGIYYTCSECNHISWTYNYCPNCGAKNGRSKQ